MSDHADDVLFNALALKKNLLNDLICINCKKPTKDWVVISVCHHTICQMCIDVATRNTPSTSKASNKRKPCCPACNVLYQSKTDLKHNTEIQSICTEIEDFLWAVHSNQYGLLEENLYPEGVEEPRIESTNNSPLKISLDSGSKNKKTKCEHSNGFISNKYKDLEEPTFDTAEQLKNLETLPLDVSSNNSSVSSVSSDHNIDDEITALTSSGSDRVSSKENTSNEDVIYGTPDRHVPNDDEPNLVVTTSYISCTDDLKVVKKWADFFNICALNIQSKWDENITHLIVKTPIDNMCPRTLKSMYALLSGCCIVDFEWIQQCLSSRTLIPEDNFILLDVTGDSSPLTAWQVSRGLIESPLNWTKNCLLYFHRSTEFDVGYSKSPIWAMKAGFVLANDMADFKSKKYKMQFILVDVPDSKDVEYIFPEKHQIFEWLTEYKTITLYIDWFLECLFRYKFIKIEFQYQVLKLNRTLLAHTDMDASLFQLED